MNKSKILKYCSRLLLILFSCIIMPSFAYATRGEEDTGMKIGIGILLVILTGIIFGTIKLIRYLKKKLKK